MPVIALPVITAVLLLKLEILIIMPHVRKEKVMKVNCCNSCKFMRSTLIHLITMSYRSDDIRMQLISAFVQRSRFEYSRDDSCDIHLADMRGL